MPIPSARKYFVSAQGPPHCLRNDLSVASCICRVTDPALNTRRHSHVEKRGSVSVRGVSGHAEGGEQQRWFPRGRSAGYHQSEVLEVRLRYRPDRRDSREHTDRLRRRRNANLEAGAHVPAFLFSFFTQLLYMSEPTRSASFRHIFRRSIPRGTHTKASKP